MHSSKEALKEFLSQIERNMATESSSVLNGFPSGFKSLDQLTHGLKPGRLSMLTGTSSSCKSLLLQKIADSLTEHCYGSVILASKTHSTVQIVNNILSGQSSLCTQALAHGAISDDEWSKVSYCDYSFNQHDNIYFLEGFWYERDANNLCQLLNDLDNTREEVSVVCIDDAIGYSDIVNGTAAKTLHSLRQLAEQYNVALIATGPVLKSLNEDRTHAHCQICETNLYAEQVDTLINLRLSEPEPNIYATRRLELKVVKNNTGMTGMASLEFHPRSTKIGCSD